MIRWLKDKKKDKRTNSTSLSEDGNEDDYGFGKDKSASKSPSSRRQLPPTPATPEEKSPHIYEEIPDLPLSCMPESEKALLQSKFNKRKNTSASGVGAMPESAGVPQKSDTVEKNDINPYMVVSVDNEVRQTPTDFHRNGTPEVHCDVIVKDTHCEILLTRKPKVSAFRLDSTVMSESGESLGGRKAIRNNTHFCSRDWRASADVNSSGNMSSAFSMTSSAFSSSSGSKVPSGTAPSSLTLGNVPEIHPLETGSGETSEKGVITYSAASNFIPRSTKLTFNPPPGNNPYKAFGSESSDAFSGMGYSSIKDNLGTSGTCLSSALDKHPGSNCVTYASIQSRDDLEPSSESRVTYASIKDQHLGDTKMKLNHSFADLQCQFQPKHHNFSSKLPNDAHDFECTNGTGIIRSVSPANSSNCIYALVTFPSEPKHYNTIGDVMSTVFPESAQSQVGVPNTDRSGVVYSSVNKSLVSETNCMSNSELVNDIHQKVSRASSFGFSEIVDNSFNVSRICCDTDSISCAGIVGEADTRTERNSSGCNRQDNCTNERIEFPMSLNHCGHNLELDFCLCSDEHSSSCGCPEAKHSQDDDVTSFASAPIDGPNSCRNCGRLVRQITYSESYSDETYEHVYASRLLIRTGRRFSSPDITFPETTAAEFQYIHNIRNPEFPYAVSRDDSWASTRNSDIIPPPYSTAANKEMLNITEDVPQIKKPNSTDILGPNDISIDSSRQLFDRFSGVKTVKPSSSTDSTNMSNGNDLRFSTSCSSNVTSVRKSNYSTDINSSDVKPEHPSILDNQRLSRVSLNTDPNRLFVKQIVDQTKKWDATLVLEPKSSAFTGILSKFSRTKSSKATKLDPSEIINQAVNTTRESAHQSEAFICDKDFEEIPEKNTKKLSKFFQRLSSKEPSKGAIECLVPTETDGQNESISKDIGKTLPLKTVCSGNYTTSPNLQKYRRDIKQSTSLSAEKNMEDGASGYKISSENREKTVGSQSQISGAKNQSCLNDSANAFASVLDQQLQDISSSQNVGGIGGETSNIKPFKTDSGDTCYEYDISTSSEGEQAGHESFLSKIKKTLNLEDEVRHLAESCIGRRKRLCKRCKQKGLYASIDGAEEGAAGGDGFCPHLAAKFGDLRAIFEDMVVDQRAAILDCLTDFTSNPYNIRSHGHDGCCRECGCEVLTSDSESLTTVYSLLSQQFRMTSPNGQTLSCESDEGTMADNSDESADENKTNPKNSNRIQYDGNSSGYDEPKVKLTSVSQKPRKKERRERKLATLTYSHVGSKEVGVMGMMQSSISKPTSHNENISNSSDFALPAAASYQDVKVIAQCSSSDSPRKSIFKKNTMGAQSTISSRDVSGLYFSHGTDSKDDNIGHSKSCDISKSRVSFITDKVLQDIYAPLPSKALSVLTSRNYGSPAGLPCNCGRPVSLATVTAHLATGENITSPTGCIKEDCFLKASSARLPHCDSDKKDEVVPVQKHFERDGKNSSQGEHSNLSDRKDIDGPKGDRDTKGVHSEVEVFANNGCSPIRKNAESNNCLSSQTKPGSRIFPKERSPVPVRDGSPLKIRPPAKQHNETGIKSDCRLPTSSLQEKVKCPQMSLPHTTIDSVGLTLTAENVINGAKCLYSEKPSSDTCKGPIAEPKTEIANKKYTRKHRLGLVALDLLPESTVDGDAADTIQAPKRFSILSRRSGTIEKMAKFFENNPDNNMHSTRSSTNENVRTLDFAENNKTIVTNKIPSSKNISTVKSSYKTSQPSSQENPVFQTQECSTNSSLVISLSNQTLSDATLSTQNKQNNLYAPPGSTNVKLIDSPVSSDRDQLPVSKTCRSSTGSKLLKENEAKLYCTKSDNESGRFKTHESKSTRGKSGKIKSSVSSSAESRLMKQRSPTPSTSSASSSSSSKKKNSHVKHKASKKSYHKKRSKHKSERSKSGHGKEERTYYYFSSDFSDIDVVEIENSKPYTTGTLTSTLHSQQIFPCKKRCLSGDEILVSSSEKIVNPSISTQKSNMDGVDDKNSEQEVYNLPSGSSELRSRRESHESGNSPQPSPEMTKLRKMKRTDVYKTKKSNNKLLSDVIIRNYDMQVYVNI